MGDSWPAGPVGALQLNGSRPPSGVMRWTPWTVAPLRYTPASLAVISHPIYPKNVRSAKQYLSWRRTLPRAGHP